MSPRLPSWIRSRNSIPRPTYLLAMLTTRRRFASASSFLASSSPSSIRWASSISRSALKRGTFPISFRYMRTGSSMLTPSGTERSMFSTSTSSSSDRITSMSMSTSSSLPLIRSTSILLDSRYSNTLSICSALSSMSRKKSLISWISRMLFFFLPRATRSLKRSKNFCVFSSMCPSFLCLHSARLSCYILSLF